MSKIEISNAFKSTANYIRLKPIVLINDKDYGTINPNTSKNYELKEGEYEIYLKSSIMKGKKIKINLKNNEELKLEFGKPIPSKVNMILFVSALGMVIVKTAVFMDEIMVVGLTIIPLIYGMYLCSKMLVSLKGTLNLKIKN